MSLTDLILDTLYPLRCVACGQRNTAFCEGCLGKVDYLDRQICPICQKAAIGGLTHSVCRRVRGLDGLYSAVAYRGAIRPLIKRYKYPPYLICLEDRIAQIMRRALICEEDIYPPGTIVTSVPLHWSRRNRRGFNQADKLAQIVAALHNYRTNLRLIKRVDFAGGLFRPPQSQLKREERLRNVKKIYGLVDEAAKENVKGSTVLLVDDLWTTGATLKECTQVIKQGGARQVYAITFARG